MPLVLAFVHLGGVCLKQLSLGAGVALVGMPPVQWCEEGGCSNKEFLSSLSAPVGVPRFAKNRFLTENGLPQALDSVQLPSSFPCF